MGLAHSTYSRLGPRHGRLEADDSSGSPPLRIKLVLDDHRINTVGLSGRDFSYSLADDLPHARSTVVFNNFVSISDVCAFVVADLRNILASRAADEVRLRTNFITAPDAAFTLDGLDELQAALTELMINMTRVKCLVA
jgi:hypothetical protein